MIAFLTLFINLLPLYALIGLGYFAGRVLKVDQHSLGSVALYLCMPVVVFGFIATLDFQPSQIILPVLIFIIQTIVSSSFLTIGKKIYGDNQANLMALCTSMGNTGYLGLPVVLSLFEQNIVAIYIFMMAGTLIHDSTVGYYITARGAFNVRDSLLKLVKFPVIYAMIAGFAVNFSGIELPEMFWTYWTHFKGTYVVVGMMIVGAAFAGIDKFVLGARFITLVFLGKFIALPALALAFVFLDHHLLQWLSTDLHHLLIVITILPPAASIATFATQMNLLPEKAATTILLGTLFALFYIPAVIWVMGL